MCLSIAVKRPDAVLAKGIHRGLEWIVTHNGSGYRCGYVRIPNGHPWHGKDYDDICSHLEVHGGLTFAEPDKPCDKGGADDAWWVGFDCAHLGDMPDPSLPNYRQLGYKNGTVKGQGYVENQCRKLCEQAAEAATP